MVGSVVGVDEAKSLGNGWKRMMEPESVSGAPERGAGQVMDGNRV